MQAEIERNNAIELKPTYQERGLDVYQLADGQSLSTFPAPQNDPEITGASKRAIKALQAFAESANAVNGDNTLTDLGKSKKLQASIRTCFGQLGRVRVLLNSYFNAVERDERALYAVPSIAPNDAVSALIDMEVRTWFHNLAPQEREQVMPSLVGGRLPVIAAALKRSPVPLRSDEEIVVKAWEQTQRIEKAEAVSALKARKENYEWAVLLLRRVTEIAVKISRLSRHGVYAEYSDIPGISQLLGIMNAPAFTPDPIEQAEGELQDAIASSIGETE